MTTNTTTPNRSNLLYWSGVGLALGLSLLWSYWPTLRDMTERWSSDSRYSHGFFVPLFALALLWFRQDLLDKVTFQLDWRGIPLIVLGALLHLAGGRFYFDWLDAMSLLPVVAGYVVLLGGWPALRWAWPGVVFLLFMVPLPFRAEAWLADPLQRGATIACTYILQTLGYAALSAGNTIRIDTSAGEIPIGVEEACNGLSMMLTFFALSTAVAIIIQRPLLDKIVVLVSALPIALLVNLGRILVTAMIMVHFEGTDLSKWMNEKSHDYAGYAMMPIALLLLLFELKLLSWLLIEEENRRPVSPISLAGMPSATRRPAAKAAGPKEAKKAPAL